jgi:hypothetical protein
MLSFLTRHASRVKGVLSGFDRVRFLGTLRWLAHVKGLLGYLSYKSVLLKEFREYAMSLTESIKQATKEIASEPIAYLPSSAASKDEVARGIAEREGLTEGLVCVLSCVEPCFTFEVGPNKQMKKLELRKFFGKCLHYYFYLIDRELGWMHVRLQTWMPFSVHVVINGREWLAQDLRRHNISFERRENCFVDLGDVARAQALMEEQQRTDWKTLLDRVLRRVHPTHEAMFDTRQLDYYWSANETEFATDVMFHSPEDLARVYPYLVRHAITSFGSADVLRFLGKRRLVQKFTKAEILSHLVRRAEGTRVRHALNGNSVKMYDKQGSVLRIETTINHTREMKVYRASESDPEGPKDYRILRKGVADLHRRSEISQKANTRYLEALSAVDSEKTLAEAAAPICRRTAWKGRSVRAINPLSEEDAELLLAVNRGEFVLLGFRNRDLCRLLFAEASDLTDQQKMTKVTRLIQFLREHGLVQKVPKTHRYQVTPKGRETLTALLSSRAASTRKLTELAA